MTDLYSAARETKTFGSFDGYDFKKNPVCPFCGKTWSAEGPCGDTSQGDWKAINNAKKARLGIDR